MPRGGELPDRLPQGRDPRARAAAQRAPGADQGSEPARARRHQGQGRHPRVDARRHPPDEAVQLQRRAHLPLPQRSPLVRALRRVRPLRGRRGQHREPRPSGQPLSRAPLRRRLPRPGDAHGAAGQEPLLHHPLVARQRERLRRQPRGPRRLDPRLRPVAPPALRGRSGGQLVPGPPDHRRDLPHVPGDRGDRPLGEVRPRRAAADHVRVLPRDGQQQREPLGLLGGDRIAPRPAGRLHLGLGRPGAAQGGRAGTRVLGLRRRLRRPAQRRGLLHQRPGVAGPHPTSGHVRVQEARAAREGRGAEPARGQDPHHQPTGLHGSRLAPRELRALGGRRRGAEGAASAAQDTTR